jgi:hypothetical protein
MIERVHEHVVSELQQSARTDTVFVVTAVLFNLIVLGINWSVAESSYDGKRSPSSDWILALLIIATLVINTFTAKALLKGRKTRMKLITGLVNMYRDNGVDKYYDATILDAYSARYSLFTGVTMCLAAISIIVPLVQRIIG